jgi:HAD superfamily hydrolase (TIGR01509 family)
MIMDQDGKNNARMVIFDWGGVLMRTEDYSPRQTWDQRLNLTFGSIENIVHGIPEWVQFQRGQITLHEYEQAIALDLGISHDTVHQMLEDFYSGDRLDAQLISLIRRLCNADIPVGLLSNNPSSLRDDLMKLQLLDLFVPCIISAEIGVMKPDQEAYQACLSPLQIPPHHALMIDDSPANVEGALAFGMAAIHFKSSIDLESQVMNWLDS